MHNFFIGPLGTLFTESVSTWFKCKMHYFLYWTTWCFRRFFFASEQRNGRRKSPL